MSKTNSEKAIKEIWSKLNQIETKIERKTTDDQKEASNASRAASGFRNRTRETKEEADRLLREIRITHTQQKEQSEKLQSLFNSNVELESTYNNKLSELESQLEELSTKRNEITTKINLLNSYFENNPNLEDEVKELDNLLATSREEASKVNQVLKNASGRKGEIDELYFEIIGSTETDEESGEEIKIEGLKDKLEKSYRSIEESIKGLTTILENIKTDSEEDYLNIESTWNDKYTTLEAEIRSLLPDALTAGLSGAYSDKKKLEILDLAKHNKNFRISIWLLVMASFIPFGVATYLLILEKPLLEVVKELPRVVLSILPLYVPLLWLAYSTNKNVKLSKRLIEEYTHKEVLSKTYEGLSSQIESIDNDQISSELRIKLLYNLLNVSSENPGKLISDYNNSDHPIMDALDKSAKLSKAVDRLERIPGFKKVSELVDKRSKRAFDEQLKKMEDVVDVATDDKSSLSPED